MPTEIKPMTYLLCQQCSHQIPYGEPYVVIEVRKKGRVVSHQELCVKCAPQ